MGYTHQGDQETSREGEAAGGHIAPSLTELLAPGFWGRRPVGGPREPRVPWFPPTLGDSSHRAGGQSGKVFASWPGEPVSLPWRERGGL